MNTRKQGGWWAITRSSQSWAFAFLVCQMLFCIGVSAQSNTPVSLAGIANPAQITRDTLGIAHITAVNEHDLFFLQGYVHAEDRLFQMDMFRRTGSGTLAELLGDGALTTDVSLRTLGLRRAAERTLPILSSRVRAALEAYAAGVNAWVATHPLPPEYGALELTRIQPWAPLDSVIVGKLIAFQRIYPVREFDTTLTLMTYQATGQAMGFNGVALYLDDLFRTAPFDPTLTLGSSVGVVRMEEAAAEGAHSSRLHPATLKLCKEFLEVIKQSTILRRVLGKDRDGGSNQWGVSGAHTATGHPMLANDTHNVFGVPNLWHPIHLRAGRINVAGSSVAGAPFIVLGQNRHICWGAANNYVDAIDVFQERVMPDPNSPSGLSIVHRGQNEPIIPIPEVFRKNNFDGTPDNITDVPPGGAIPLVTLIVPRRNNGPIVALDPGTGVALSVQYTGFGPTRELECILIWNSATGLSDFLHGLQFNDIVPANWAYADRAGNIGFFSSSEVPIREDLQAGMVRGLRPDFIRDGTGGNEWLPVQTMQPGQAAPYEILPFEEMPHVINPAAGWFVNCNNDPLGHTLDNNPLNQLRPNGGLYYLTTFYESYRAGRVTQLIQGKLERGEKISLADMSQIQADTVLIDAQVFVPYILRAYQNAQSTQEPLLAAFANDARLAQAIERLRQWDFTTPTGIPEGWDASDPEPGAPSSTEVAESVAATIYSVWRGQFIRNTIDAPLVPFGLPLPDNQFSVVAVRHLLDNFESNGGIGASGLDFFNVPGVASATDRRDFLILRSLSAALALLSGDSFAGAYARSMNLDDYRWGKLHRLVLEHQLGGVVDAFNIPPAFGMWPHPLTTLVGIPVDGGFSTVDVGDPVGGVRTDSLDGFMFDHGPTQRFVAEARPDGVRAYQSMPAGPSGVPGTANYISMLPGWLSNDPALVLTRKGDVRRHAASTVRFVPN